MPAAVSSEEIVDQLIPIKRVARSLHLSVSTVAKMSLRGDFPPPVPLGARKKMYYLPALNAWWRERLGGLDGSPFPLLPEEPGDNDFGAHQSAK